MKAITRDGKELADHDLMTRAEVAEVFGVAGKTVTRYADDGKFPVAARTIGGHRRFRAGDVRALQAVGEAAAAGKDGGA